MKLASLKYSLLTLKPKDITDKKLFWDFRVTEMKN